MAIKYPGMGKNEALLWETFKKKHGEDFNSFQYNFRVGKGVIAPTKHWTQFEEGYKMLTQKRIDVIAQTDSSIWIIEVRPHAGLSVIGRLLMYRTLFIKEFNPGKEVKLVAITDHATEDSHKVAGTYSIKIFEV